MTDLLVLSPALDEIEQAADWYKKINKELSKAFVAKIYAQLERIQQHPRLYPERFDDLRVALVRRFPYKILYEYDDRADLVVILSVSHHKMNKPY